MTVRVGAGGWGYFRGGLPAYARGFAFVEVNATFYRRIPLVLARRWRRAVPEEFAFAVKGNREVTHASRLRATPAARAALAHDAAIARVLGATTLVLEAPPSLAVGPDEATGLRDLLASMDLPARVGLEARAHAGRSLPRDLARVMEDLRILDVVDLSREKPRIPDEIVYARLFGPGEHNVYEFDDDELRQIDRAGRDAVEVTFAFHGVRMYKDAARFLTFKRTGSFPPATSGTGITSLEAVLRPDARFPTTRDELLRGHGWKVIDLDPTTRVHAARILAALPPGPFPDLGAVLAAAETGIARSRGPPAGAFSGLRPPSSLHA